MKHVNKLAVGLTLMVGLSGCAQITKTADAVWGGTKSAANFVTKPVAKLLRGSPDQDYVFVEEVPTSENYEVVMYDAPQTVDYSASEYEVEIYDSSQLRPAPVQTYQPVSPRDVAFVRLNGAAQMQDWRNCEMVHRGYLFADEANFRVNPEFEVCMRNKGYVMESEVAQYGTYGARLTAPQPATSYSAGYSFP